VAWPRLFSKPDGQKIDRDKNGDDEGQQGLDERKARGLNERRVERIDRERSDGEKQTNHQRRPPPPLDEEHAP